MRTRSRADSGRPRQTRLDSARGSEATGSARLGRARLGSAAPARAERGGGRAADTTGVPAYTFLLRQLPTPSSGSLPTPLDYLRLAVQLVVCIPGGVL